MRRSLLGAVAALGLLLLAASPAHAEQEADPLAGLISSGAPLIASLSPVSTAAVAGPGPYPASAEGARPLQPGDAPAVELPAIPNPLDLLGGASLDPRAWAGAFVDALVHTLGRALLGAIRGFTDWALGLGGSSLNFVTRTPEAGTYESATVRSLWGALARRRQRRARGDRDVGRLQPDREAAPQEPLRRRDGAPAARGAGGARPQPDARVRAPRGRPQQRASPRRSARRRCRATPRPAPRRRGLPSSWSRSPTPWWHSCSSSRC